MLAKQTIRPPQPTPIPQHQPSHFSRTLFDCTFFKKINQASAQAEEAAEVDVPEEYLDPIMADVMMDPVELPSGHVMDRKNIERIILTDDADPFSSNLNVFMNFNLTYKQKIILK